MTNFEAMRIKHFLSTLIDFNGRNRHKEGEELLDATYTASTRSVGLGVFAETALDILGETTWPDEVKHETA